MLMTRAYNVVDADGHILEPLDLWDHYIDPKFRDRAPRIVKGDNGKERLVIEEHMVGDSRISIGRIGGGGGRPRGRSCGRHGVKERQARARGPPDPPRPQ